MSSQIRGIRKKDPRRKVSIRRSAASMKNVAYLIRTHPRIKTERDAKLFLNKLQRDRPNDIIRVMEKGRIFSYSKDGKITDIGKDGKDIRTFSKTSEQAKKVRAIFPHYTKSKDEVRASALRAGKSAIKKSKKSIIRRIF